MRTYIFSASGPQAESVRKLVRNKIIPLLVTFSLTLSSVPVRAFSADATSSASAPPPSMAAAFTLENGETSTFSSPLHEPLSAKPKTKHAFSHDLPENPISPLGTKRADFAIPEIANNLPLDAFTNVKVLSSTDPSQERIQATPNKSSAPNTPIKRRTKRALPPFSSAPASLSCTPPAVEPELAELARALNYDLSTIYEYVYYTIETSPLSGAQKSAFATYLDRRGTNIDQNVLFVTLLRQSCIDANYLQADTTLSGDMLANHFKIFQKASDTQASSTDSVILFHTLLWGGWLACMQLEGESCVNDPKIEALSDKKLIQVNLKRFWTEVKLKDKTYRLDPSLKSHKLQSPINLAQAMGYDQKAYLDQALKGSSSLPNLDSSISSLKNIAPGQVKNLLNLYAQNLTDYLQRTGPDRKIQELTGAEITSDLFGAELTTPPESQIFETIPEEFSTRFKVSLSDGPIGEAPPANMPAANAPVLFSHTFRADELGAQRLTLTYNSSNQPILMQDGKQIHIGPTTTGAKQILTFETFYPYPNRGDANNIPEQKGQSVVEPGSIYALIFLAGEAGRDRFTRHQKNITANLINHPSLSEIVAGETLTALGFAYLAQFAQIQKRTYPLFQTVSGQYASMGVAGYHKGKGEETSDVQDLSAPYVDFPISNVMAVTPVRQAETPSQPSITWALLGSALESTSVQQLQQNEAVSTARLFDLALQQGSGFIEATQANWDKLAPSLTQWTINDKADLKAFLQATPQNKVFLTENGEIVKNKWKGGAYYTFHQTDRNVAIQYKISGGYAGGFGTQHASLSPPLMRELSRPPTQTYTIQPQMSLDPIDLLTGDYVLDNEDLRLGKSNPALDLILTRSYHSGKYQELGPLGYGWTHNFDIKLLKDSDSFEALGERSALAAVPMLVALTLIQDLNKASSPSLPHVVLGSLTASWLMDQLVDNALTLKIGHQSQKFIKIPTKNGRGRYLPPPGSADQLFENADNTFQLVQKNGTQLNFSKDGLLTEQKDRNDQTFRLSYDDQKRLIKVINPIQRAFTFTYKADGLIQEVFDQTYRVTYEYDAQKRLIQSKNKAGHATKYLYEASNRLTQFFTPASPNKPFVTNVYDQNGKIKTQTDANGNLWTYRFANRQRSQETDPYGNSRVFFYDSHGNQIKERDVEGLETKTILDGLGRPIEILLPLGDKITQTFDAAHNLLSRTPYPFPGDTSPPKVERWEWTSAFHQVRSYQNAKGQKTYYHYDIKGNLTRVSLPPVAAKGGILRSPQQVRTYESHGLLFSETDEENRTKKRYTYDPVTHELLSVTEESLQSIASLASAPSKEIASSAKEALAADPPAVSRTTRYTYDTVGNILSETNPEGQKTEYFYDNSHRLIESRSSDTTRARQKIDYDPDGRPVLWTEYIHSEVTKIAVEVAEAKEATKDATSELADNDKTKKVTKVTYTPSGKIASRTENHGATTTYVYDKLDRLVLTTSPNGIKTHTTYDARSNLLEKRQSRSVAETSSDSLAFEAALPIHNFTYDVAGQLIKETVSNGVSDEISAGAAYTSTYAYDQQYNRKETSHSELKEINTPVTASTDTEYSPPEAETSPTLSDTPQAETEEASHESSTKPEGISENTSRIEETILLEKRTYYPTGLLKTLQQGGGPEIEFGYDGFKRLKSLVFPALTSPANMPNASPALADLSVAASTPSEASTPEASLVIPISPPRPYEAYAYDTQDRLTVKQTRAKEQIQFQYDALGRKTAESIFDSKNNLVYQTSTQYDATGRPTCMVRLLSNYLSYTPTIALPVSSNTPTENSSSASSDTTTVFALAPPVDMPTGSPLATPPAASSEAAPLASAPLATALPTETPAANKATGGGIEASLPYFSTISLCFVYDSLGRLIGEQQIGRSLQEAASILDSAQGEGATQEPSNLLSEGTETKSTGPGVIGPKDVKQTPLNVSWELDKNNNRTSLTWPATNESVESTPYKVLYAYDSLNRLTEVKESTGHTLGTYAYDSFSQRSQTTLGDSSLNLTYTYGTNGQVEILKNKWKNGKLDQNFGYDANLQQISRTMSDPRFLPAHIKTQNEQLIANALNQYTEITKDGVKQTLTYDLDGNLHSYDGWTYKHNALGQLVEAWRGKDSERIHIIYTYDMLGRRSSKTVNGVITYFLWAGNQEIGEYDRDWKLLKRYVPGAGLDEIVAMVESDGTRRYPFTDKLGSVIGLVDDQGQLVEKHAYTAFGVEVTKGENDPEEGIVLGTPRFCAADVAKKNEACVKDLIEAHKHPELHDKGYPFRFAGRRYDPETGLYYNRARYYSPMLGRFLEPDPIGVAGGLNLYAYANNNPINYTDPMGLFGGLPGAGAGALFGAGSAYFSDPRNATWQSVMGGALVGAAAGATSSWVLGFIRLPAASVVPGSIIASRAGVNVVANAGAGAFSSVVGDLANGSVPDFQKAAIMGAITGTVPLITGETAIIAAASGLRQAEETLIHGIWGGYSAAIATGFQYGVNQALAERQAASPAQVPMPTFVSPTPRK